MPSPAGWREVPCVECGRFVEGIDFGERCDECFARRLARARRVARRAAAIVAGLVVIWNLWHLPAATLGRWYAAIAVPITYLLVRVIAGRIAMEFLP
jgi:DNA-directed RNA polymerase subunit RPC12/RpoP